MRPAPFVLLALFALPARAAGPAVGDVYEVKKECLAATSMLFFEDLMEAMEAKDYEGLEQMVKQDKVVVLAVGNRLRVLKVQPKDTFYPHSFAECRLLVEDKAVAKVCVAGVTIGNPKVLAPYRK